MTTTIKYDDGTTKVFGANGKAFTDSNLTDNILSVITYFNQTDSEGVGISATYSIDISVPENQAFLIELAGRGAAGYIKDAINVTKRFSDLFDDKGNVVEKGAFTIVSTKISELESQKLSSRESGVGTKQPLAKVQLAYARTHNIDVESQEGYKLVSDWYDTISKENRRTFAKEVKENETHELHAAFLAIDAEQYAENAERTRKAKEEAAKVAAEKNYALLGVSG